MYRSIVLNDTGRLINLIFYIICVTSVNIYHSLILKKTCFYISLTTGKFLTKPFKKNNLLGKSRLSGQNRDFIRYRYPAVSFFLAEIIDWKTVHQCHAGNQTISTL